MKQTRILILLALMTASAFGQHSVKYDEFSRDPKALSSPLTDRGNRFARQLQKERTSKGVIIFYNERKGMFPLNTGEEWAGYTKGILVNGYQIPPERIVIIDGGYNELATLEYWLTPQNAALPTPSSVFSKADTVICPEIRVADGFRQDKKQPLVFSVSVKGADPNNALAYRWNISAGEIRKGQGSNAVSVDVSNTDATRITASVHIENLKPECSNYSSASTEVGRFPYLYSEIRYNYSYLAALLDGLYIELNNDSKLEGLVIFYGPRVGTRGEVAARMSAARKYLSFRRFDTSRISIIHGGFRESEAVELYLVPVGVELPRPSPTVDEKFVIFTDIPRKKVRNRSVKTKRSSSRPNL